MITESLIEIGVENIEKLILQQCFVYSNFYPVWPYETKQIWGKTDFLNVQY